MFTAGERTRGTLADEVNGAYPLPEAEMGPAAPSCTGPLYPAEACHTEPPHTSAWAGSHQRHTSSLEGGRQGTEEARCQVRHGTG